MLYKQIKKISKKDIQKMLNSFLREDCPAGDATTKILKKIKNKKIRADIITREKMVFVGKEIIDVAFKTKKNTIKTNYKDGDVVPAGALVSSIYASYGELLKKERVVLNLIQHLSGIASFVLNIKEKAQKQNIRILDTRKTTPGLRIFEKYAVYKGGGTNHRLNLSEGILIKDNHIALYNNLEELLLKIDSNINKKPIEIEVENFEQIEIALKFNVSAVLLDNMSPAYIKKIVPEIRNHPNGKKLFIEVSGGVDDKNIDSYLIKGIDAISMGCITHSIKNKDISMKFNV